MAHWEGREVLIHPISVRSPARAQVCIFSFFLSEFSGWGPKLVLIHQVPRSNPELPNFLSFSLSSRIVPPFRTNLLQDKRFRGGDRVQIHNHESHSWFGPPFASCDYLINLKVLHDTVDTQQQMRQSQMCSRDCSCVFTVLVVA